MSLGEPRCRNCKFTHMNGQVRECRFNPPVPSPLLIPDPSGPLFDPEHPELGKFRHIGQLNSWPGVEDDEWCGQWKTKVSVH